jgi:hypothetical protein
VSFADKVFFIVLKVNTAEGAVDDGPYSSFMDANQEYDQHDDVLIRRLKTCTICNNAGKGVYCENCGKK